MTSRIWRLRKRQQTIDALLHQGTSHVSLEFVLNGRRIITRTWPTRRQAMKAAIETRGELERAGWATHW